MRSVLGPKKCARIAREIHHAVVSADYRGGSGCFRVWLTHHKFLYTTTGPPYVITGLGNHTPEEFWAEYPQGAKLVGIDAGMLVPWRPVDQ